ncbi:MAG: hypothetical protein VW955_01715, partial [Gammaproteobacteria bacterium]
MKKYIYILSAFLIVSCNDDFLDIDPKTELTNEVVFNDPGLAEKAVLGAYRGLWTVDGFENFNTFHNSVLVDETVFNGLVYSWLNVWWEGNISPDNPFGLGGFGGYGHDRKELHRWD